MTTPPGVRGASDGPFVSTGHYPAPDHVRKLLLDAYERYGSNSDGQVSQVYPALARVRRDLFGVCVVAASGEIYPLARIIHERSMER